MSVVQQPTRKNGQAPAAGKEARVVNHLWGTSRPLHQDRTTRLEEARGRAGGESSTHMHRHQSNTFLVLEGKVAIVLDGIRLVFCRNDSYTVPAGRRHRMEFVTDATVLELYVALPGQAAEPGDIVRFDEGKAV